MKKKIILIIIAVAACAAYFAHRNGNFLYSGTIEATEVDISSRISGIISAYEIKEGDFIARNAVLARLECDDIKLSADIAQKDYERAVQTQRSGSMSKEVFDRLKYRKDDTALKADWCTIKSPLDGKVLYKYHENGELINPGQKLATIADLSEVWAYIYVPHDAIAKLSLGMTVKGYLPELKNKEFPGKITLINEEAEFTPKNVQTRLERTRLVFGVKVTFPNKEGLLKPGMTLEVKL